MTCDRVRDRLPEYICQALEGKDLLDFEAHLKNCPECRSELEALRKLDARLKQDIPALWENIKPSAQFLAQLKGMKFDPQPEPKPGIIDFLSGIWVNHRMALATGLSVCLVVVLAATGMFSTGSDDDDDQVASREVTLSTADGAAGASVTVTGGGFTPESAPLEESAPSSDESIMLTMPSATSIPKEAPEPEVAYESLDTNDATSNASQTDLAITIALHDSRIEEYLGEQEYKSIQVISTPLPAAGNTLCDGPTVVIEKLGSATPENAFLLACIDMKNSKVVSIIFSATRPPDRPPDTTYPPSPLPGPPPESNLEPEPDP